MSEVINWTSKLGHLTIDHTNTVGEIESRLVFCPKCFNTVRIYLEFTANTPHWIKTGEDPHTCD